MLTLGARKIEVFISTGPPPKNTPMKGIRHHWRGLDKYYGEYEEFLKLRSSALKDQRNWDRYQTLAKELVDRRNTVLRAMTDLYNKRKYKSNELSLAWKYRVEKDDEIRTFLKMNTTDFDRMENIYLFNRALVAFDKRDEPGILVVHEELRLLEDRRKIVIHEGRIDEEVQLREEIERRIALYEEIPHVYQVIANHRLDERLKEVREKIAAIIQGKPKESLIDEIMVIVEIIMEEDQHIIYDVISRQLIYRGTRKPVTTNDELFLHLPSVEYENNTVQLNQFVAENQLISNQKKVIERVANGFMMDEFLAADIREEIKNWTGIEGTLFDRFRGMLCNCIKRTVNLDGSNRQVLIATNHIEEGNDLFMDYDDAELYKIWVYATENKRVVVPVMVKQPTNKIDNLIAELTSKLTQLLIEEDSTDNRRRKIDYTMRIDVLRRIQSQ